MALVKKHKEQEVEVFPTFATLEEAQEYYHSVDDYEHKSHASDKMAEFDGGPERLVVMLKDHDLPKDLASEIAATLAKIERKRAPIESIMELLKLRNAYVRNLGISILQDHGDAIKYYIVKFLIGDDRDLRIFAINVLGDVDFAESREMLIELLEHEEDINVAMTAVDYMAEIGEEEDIVLLESLKARFDDDAYVTFGVDGAIRSIKG